MKFDPRLNDIYLALCHPARRIILERLAEGEATVGELVSLFDFTQPAITGHIKLLERAGLVTRGRDAQFRPVRLNSDALSIAERWIGAQLKSATDP